VKGYLVKLFPKVIEQLPGCEILKLNIQPDHIHMILVIPPKYAVATVVGKIKGMTSIELRKKFEWLRNHYFRENVLWSPGYFVSTVGIEEQKVLKYVEYQGRQDSGQAKLDL
jgi:putative transposase